MDDKLCSQQKHARRIIYNEAKTALNIFIQYFKNRTIFSELQARAKYLRKTLAFM